ncbi:hypothetical protein COW46_01750 [Candidatus Gracilibacteria bacterium CG17_big_fil_post_rev_8_21_14_2_50_48_13]|nr:MAG: hypothetical protein COW46_01750 [Candidatus Gracilibacteria bacterium CG17_big_fil_post_rev_8_21_14_2_50_48_13]
MESIFSFSSMQKIIPHLWFATQAKEAAAFYTRIFPESHIDHTTLLRNTPSGDSDLVSFTIFGQKCMAISAGPIFTLNPSVSFMVNFDPSQDPAARENMDTIWGELLEGGQVLMPLGEYPFSPHYGWIQDKFGVSWQLILTNPEGDPRPKLMPSMLFVGDAYGKAREATELYMDLFSHAPHARMQARRGQLAEYPAGMEPNKPGDVMFTDVELEGQWFVAMDSAYDHAFAFNEAFSFIIECEDQDEIDYFWEKLSRVPKAAQCGWCKDAYGVSWQVTPRILGDMMQQGAQEQIDRLVQAFLPMKKLEIAPLVRAFEGK